MSQIRQVRLEELELLRSLAMETYADTFGQHTTADNLQTYFETAYGPETLQAELENPESQTFFILVDGAVAGFLKVNWGQAQTEQELPNAFEIQRLYIRKTYQGLGLGQKLFEHALTLARQGGFDWAWLGVWEGNVKAQAFYQKFGFEKFSEHAFVQGDQVDTDWLLKKALQ